MDITAQIDVTDVVMEVRSTDPEVIRAGEAELFEKADGRVYDVTSNFLEGISLGEDGKPKYAEDAPKHAIRSYVAIREGDDTPEYFGLPVVTAGFELVRSENRNASDDENDPDYQPVYGQTVAMRTPLHVAVAMAESIIEANAQYEEAIHAAALKKAKRNVAEQMGLSAEDADKMSNRELLTRVMDHMADKYDLNFGRKVPFPTEGVFDETTDKHSES